MRTERRRVKGTDLSQVSTWGGTKVPSTISAAVGRAPKEVDEVGHVTPESVIPTPGSGDGTLTRGRLGREAALREKTRSCFNVSD